MSSLLPFDRGPELEWVGARYTLPEPVVDDDSEYRPEVVLWLELPTGLLVGSLLMDPRKTLTFAQTLDQTINNPHEGPSRRPALIRVPNEGLARELRGSAGGIPIIVAPAPELDETFAQLTEALAAQSQPEPSYLGDGEIAPAAIAELFSAAGVLFRTAPWRQVADQQIVRIDIPEYGIDGACLSVIGAARESFGVLLFRSVEDFDGFGDGLRRPSDGQPAMWSLSLGPKKELPPSMFQEIKEHRWPVAGARAYPVIFSVDVAWQPVPFTERDVRIMTACTRGFLSFFKDHGSIFTGGEEVQPVRVSVSSGEVTVILTAPYVDSAVVQELWG